MNVAGVAYRSIWLDEDGWRVCIVDQTRLPYAFVTLRLSSPDEVATAIRLMQVRGAPLIGAAAAYGVALAMRLDPSDRSLVRAIRELAGTRPTAVNLRWALERMRTSLAPLSEGNRKRAAYALAGVLCDEDVEVNRAIGVHGLRLLRDAAGRRTGPLRILTHCNAGWLATVDWGTATAPIYMAHDAGIDVHVWVDETRPRNQGARLTAWELAQHGVPNTVLPDAAAAHLMQRGFVDVVLVGTDRTTAAGDVANKIGTYPLALAAMDNAVPFYVAAPSSSIDWTLEDGLADVPIEERDAREVTHVTGADEEGVERTVRVTPPGTPAANYAFDITPARIVTAIITERGVTPATRAGLAALFPDRREHAPL